MESAKTIYNGIEIVFDEASERWKFTLRDVDRTATTLAKARQAIDAPEPTGKPKFTRTEVYYAQRYSGQAPIKATVTGISDRGYPRISYIDKYGDRRVETTSEEALKLVTPQNTISVEKIASIYAQQEALSNEVTRLIREMDGYKLPKVNQEVDSE